MSHTAGLGLEKERHGRRGHALLHIELYPTLFPYPFQFMFFYCYDLSPHCWNIISSTIDYAIEHSVSVGGAGDTS